MKLLTKNTDYAARALLHLGLHKGNFVSAKEISEKEEIPYQYLRKLLQVLLKHKIVASRDGGAGGFRLHAEPKDIKIIDLINIFQGGMRFSECIFRKQICPNRSKCVLRGSILEIEDSVNKKFTGLTIEKLIKQTNNKRRKT